MEITPTRFIQSKVRVVTSLNGDPELTEETEKSEDSLPVGSRPTDNDGDQGAEETMS